MYVLSSKSGSIPEFQSVDISKLVQIFNLFDDILLLREGQILFHGSRDSLFNYLHTLGLRRTESEGMVMDSPSAKVCRKINRPL